MAREAWVTIPFQLHPRTSGIRAVLNRYCDIVQYQPTTTVQRFKTHHIWRLLHRCSHGRNESTQQISKLMSITGRVREVLLTLQLCGLITHPGCRATKRPNLSFPVVFKGYACSEKGDIGEIVENWNQILEQDELIILPASESVVFLQHMDQGTTASILLLTYSHGCLMVIWIYCKALVVWGARNEPRGLPNLSSWH